MKPDTSTALVLERMKRHADVGPAIFSLTVEDARRVLNWIGVLNGVISVTNAALEDQANELTDLRPPSSTSPIGISFGALPVLDFDVQPGDVDDQGYVVSPALRHALERQGWTVAERSPSVPKWRPWPLMKDPTITPAPAVWPPRRKPEGPLVLASGVILNDWAAFYGLEREPGEPDSTLRARLTDLILRPPPATLEEFRQEYEIDFSGKTWDVQVATPEELAMMMGEAPVPWKSGGFIWDLPSDLDTGFHPRRSHGRGHYNGDRMPAWDGARYAK